MSLTIGAVFGIRCGYPSDLDVGSLQSGIAVYGGYRVLVSWGRGIDPEAKLLVRKAYSHHRRQRKSLLDIFERHANELLE
jgi:hypothetical protein